MELKQTIIKSSADPAEVESFLKEAADCVKSAQLDHTRMQVLVLAAIVDLGKGFREMDVRYALKASILQEMDRASPVQKERFHPVLVL